MKKSVFFASMSLMLLLSPLSTLDNSPNFENNYNKMISHRMHTNLNNRKENVFVSDSSIFLRISASNKVFCVWIQSV